MLALVRYNARTARWIPGGVGTTSLFKECLGVRPGDVVGENHRQENRNSENENDVGHAFFSFPLLIFTIHLVFYRRNQVLFVL